MRHLFVFNDAPYGNQRSFNGLRWAAALSRKSEVRVFLLGDGVLCGLSGLNPAHADYNPQELLRAIAKSGAAIAACGTCLDARGISENSLINEVRRSGLDELIQWTEESDKVVNC